MFTTNNIEVFPSWPVPHLLSEQMLLAFMSLLPIAAYPFLPSVRRSGVRCEFFLIWPSLLIVALVTMVRVIEHGSGMPTLRIAPWQVILIWLSASAGIQGLRVPSSREPKPQDFSKAARYLPTFFITWLLIIFDDIFLPKPAEVGWISHLLRLLVTIVGIMAVIYVVSLFSIYYAPKLLLGTITRRVSWWYWLPENGAVDDFAPWWSIILVIAMIIVPLLLFMTVLHSREISKLVWRTQCEL